MSKNNSNNICLVSDIHFGVNKNSEIFLESSMNYFRDELVPYLQEHNISTIAILGDLFDNRNTINVRIIDEVNNLFSNILKDFTVYILVGNHDTYYKTSIDVHSLKFLSYLDNVEIIDNITYKTIMGKNILFCPWIVDYEDSNVINTLVEPETDLLFGHFDIIGFSLNSTRVSTIGLDVDVFENYKKVFTGHYHKPSSKQIGTTEIVYIGSPYQMDRNDKNEDKGVIILNLDTLKYERVYNTTSIKFIEVKYPDVPSEDTINGNIVDVIIDIDKDDIVGDVIEKYSKSIEELSPISRVNVHVNVKDDIDVDMSSVGDNISSIPDLVKIYIDNDDEIENKSKILKHIMEIYNEVI